MFLIRKLGSLLRGSATPFQVHAACLLGALLGFTPSLTRAPALGLGLLLLLFIVNANLFVAGLVGGLAHLAVLATMPLAFSIGRFLLDGPTRGLFVTLINAPVGAWCGLEYYVCSGGLALGLLFGLVAGFAINLPLKGFRNAMSKAEAGSGFYARHKDGVLFRFLSFVFFGKRHKLDSYQAVAERKVGNPIRVTGAVVAALAVGGVWFGLGKLTGPLLTRELKSGLEAANGATVDVGGVELDLPGQRITVRELALCDKEALDHDLFRASLLEGDLSGADLLRKRFKIERLVAKDALHGAPRAKPGVRVTPETEPTPPPDPDDSGSKTLDDYLQDAATWKNRLKQGKEWLDKIKRQPRGEGGAPADGPTLKERLELEVEQKGWRNVAASHLIEGAPALQIGELVAEGIRSESLGGRLIDLKIENLSTDPGLVDAPPRVTIRSREGDYAIDAGLAGEARVRGESFLDVKLANLPTDAIVAQLEKKLGHKPARGGTMETGFKLAWSDAREAAFDTPLAVVFKNTTLDLPKLGATSVKEFALPLGLKGPLDNPRVNVDMDGLADNLAKAGAGELADKLKSELAGRADAAKKQATDAVQDAIDKAKKGKLDELKDDAKKLPGDLKDLNPFGKKKDDKKPPKKDEKKPDPKADGGGG